MVKVSYDSLLLMFIQEIDWHLTPTTINTWLSFITKKWDSFIGIHPKIIKKINLSTIKFRQDSLVSYNYFLQFSSFIDFCSLDINYLKYDSKRLVISFLYIFLLKQLKFLRRSQIISKKSWNFNKTRKFNEFYQEFIDSIFEFQLIDLLPTIQYAASFFILPKN